MLKEIILSSIIVLSVQGLVAQDNIIKLGSTLSSLGVQYERALTEDLSIEGHIGMTMGLLIENNDFSFHTGLSYYVKGRYYLPSKKRRGRMDGWFVSAYYKSLKINHNRRSYQLDVQSAGLAVGRQWVLPSDIALGFYFGVGTNSNPNEYSYWIFDRASVFPHFGLQIGRAF